MLGLKIQSWTGGTLLGIFLMTVLLKTKVRLDAASVIVAYIIGTAAVALNVFYLEWNWNFNVYLGCGGSMLALWVWSQLHSYEPKNGVS